MAENSTWEFFSDGVIIWHPSQNRRFLFLIFLYCYSQLQFSTSVESRSSKWMFFRDLRYPKVFIGSLSYCVCTCPGSLGMFKPKNILIGTFSGHFQLNYASYTLISKYQTSQTKYDKQNVTNKISDVTLGFKIR